MKVEEYRDPYLGDVIILVDKGTRIMYMYVKYYDSTTVSKALTIIYNEKGEPKKYNGVFTN